MRGRRLRWPYPKAKTRDTMGAWEDGFAAGYRAAWERAVSSVGEGRILMNPARGTPGVRAPARPKRSRAPSAYNKRLGAAIRRINKRAKKKDGDYRKGWSRSKVFKMAHKEVRRK